MEERYRREIVEVSHALHSRGWVANHDGNLSARLDGSGGARLLCTPTAVSKGDVSPESLIVVGPDNAVLQGTRKPFSELRLHRVAYAARPDVNVVIHAHPPTATGFAVAGVALGPAFMAEPVVSLGESVPLVPYGLVGSPDLDEALSRALQGADAVLLANHGVLTVGPSFELALLRMELVEHLCKIALVARQLGGPVPIPRGDVEKLLEQRAKAGLGVAKKPEEPNLWTSPATAAAAPAPAGDVHALVAEALKRFGR